MEAELTHWKKLVNPLYIGAYSLQPGEEKIVEIISVGKEKVKGTDGKDTECTVAKLKNEKPFILNKTNCKRLEKLFKSPYTQHWIGKKIIIYAEPVKAFGDVVDALRIRPTHPIMPELTPTSAKWAGAIVALKDNKTTLEAIEKAYSLSDENKELLVTQSI